MPAGKLLTFACTKCAEIHTQEGLVIVSDVEAPLCEDINMVEGLICELVRLPIFGARLKRTAAALRVRALVAYDPAAFEITSLKPSADMRTVIGYQDVHGEDLTFVYTQDVGERHD